MTLTAVAGDGLDWNAAAAARLSIPPRGPGCDHSASSCSGDRRLDRFCGKCQLLDIGSIGYAACCYFASIMSGNEDGLLLPAPEALHLGRNALTKGASLSLPYPIKFSSSPRDGSEEEGGWDAASLAWAERRVTRPLCAGGGAAAFFEPAAALRFMPLVGGGRSRSAGSMTGS